MTNHLFDEIRARARHADDPFMVLDAGQTLSYGDLWRRSAQHANALVHCGVRPGDRVAAQIDKCPDALLLYIACLRAGAVFLPLNPAYTPAEIEYFLSDALPQLFICRPADAALLGALCAKVGTPRCETLATEGGSFAQIAMDASGSFVDAQRGPDDLAALLYTSGTTGRAKGAMLSHENLASNARTLTKTWGFTRADRLIHALPIFHTHGLFVATNVTLFAGASMIFLPRFDAAEVLPLLKHATALMGVPTFYTRLLDQPGLTVAACATMRLFISGSAPLLAETHRTWTTRTGHAILERYGMTETNMITSNPYLGQRKAGTVGLPLPGISLRLRDTVTGAAPPVGHPGMIEVKGPNVFQGYWNLPEKTAAEFTDDGFFVTGDIGQIDDDGYVQIVGRGKDLVITGGFNVYPKEVETEIDALPGVLESAVIGLPHPDFGEAVTAIVSLEAGETLDETTAITALSTRLARFKCPKRIIVVEDLPRNAMGKVQKALLRETYARLYGSGTQN